MSVVWLKGDDPKECAKAKTLRQRLPFLLEGTDFYDGTHVVCPSGRGPMRIGAGGEDVSLANASVGATPAAGVASGTGLRGRTRALASSPYPAMPYTREGAWTGPGQLCSSPLWFNQTLYLMSSRISNVSHFCIFDGATGEQLSCPPSSNL